MVSKGKEKVDDNGKRKGKRKLDEDKTGRKRKNRGVLQFFEDSAYQVDEDEEDSDSSSDDSIFGCSVEEEVRKELDVGDDPAMATVFHVVPKVEDISEEAFERMLEERYKPGSGLVRYAEDGYGSNRSSEVDISVPLAYDEVIWKVKCMVGRERHSAFCLMQKYADLKHMGTKLPIVSACAIDHVKGYVFIEAQKLNDIFEACKGICSVYSTRSVPISISELYRLASARSKSGGISQGMWARVKNGKYKGDLAQVAAVNHARNKVTVKLVPRIDLKAMAEKIGGGVAAKRGAIPPQRLISCRELEEFRPLIQCRRDRDTKEMFEVLDGMMLKDGYLYKKIAIDSLTFWGVTPTRDEIIKFEPSAEGEAADVQWLSQLYGEKKEKPPQPIMQDKGGGKSEGSSSASVTDNVEEHNLVFFGRDFGVVVGSEKDGVKVIKEGSEGPLVVNVKQSALKSASFDKKLFSVLDRNSVIVSINDIVRIMDGTLKGREGQVKKIYRGVLFLFDATVQENSGYFCAKAQVCEKVNVSGDPSKAKENEPGPSGFADLPSSPQSPLFPEKPFQDNGNKTNFKNEDNGMFSVGQLLRIRVGPLKGYLCRVLAIRRSDITVKLDSQPRILTVKCDHLTEVRGRSSAINRSEESGVAKSFDFLGTENGENKGTDDVGWEVKANSDQNSSWGAGAANEQMVSETGLGGGGGWGASSGSKQADGSNSNSWEKSVAPHQNIITETPTEDSWGKAADKWNSSREDASASRSAWGQSGGSLEKQNCDLVNASENLESQKDSWIDSVGLKKPEESTWGSGSSIWGKGTESPSAGASEKWSGKIDSGLGNRGGASSGAKVETGDHAGWNQEAVGNKGWDKTNDYHVDEESRRNQGWNANKDGVTDWPDKSSGWGKVDLSSEWDGRKASEGTCASWNQTSLKNDGEDNSRKIGKDSGGGSSSGWGQNSSSKIGMSSGWGSAVNDMDEAGKGQGNWDKQIKPDDSKSTWNMETASGKGTGWQPGSWNNVKNSEMDSEKASEQTHTSWNQTPLKNEGEDNSWKVVKDSDVGSSSGWGQNKGSNQGMSSGWGSASNEMDKADNGQGDTKSTWNTGTASGKETGWQSGSWKNEKNSGGGSSSGWGQGNWSKNATSVDSRENQCSDWSGRSNWRSGNTDADNSGEGGRGGRGGRGDRGGFRGRGGFSRGGFGGRGCFEGRGGSGRDGGFRGRGGGFRGRGRGGWNSGGGSSNEDNKPHSWGERSDSWKTASGGGSWSQGGNDDDNKKQGWNSSWNNVSDSNALTDSENRNKSWTSDVSTPVNAGIESSAWDKAAVGDASGNSNSSWGQKKTNDRSLGSSASGGNAATSWGDGGGKGGW